MSCSEASASRGASVMAASGISMTALTIELAAIAPIAELCAGALRIGRAGQLGKDAAQVGFRLVARARERPGFGEPGQVFAAVVPAEPGEEWSGEAQTRSR